MIRIIRTIRPALSVAALGTFLFIASALALPQQVEAQMDCAGCIYAGDYAGDLGNGQPGAGWDCGSQPEGLTECSTGNTLGRQWCETGGSMCQSLMFLDFTEDGTASWGTAAGDEPAASTCDGVLLRRYTADDTSPSYDVAPTLVL